MNLPFASVTLPTLKGANWYEGFKRIKILTQVLTILGTSYFAYNYWKEAPVFAKEFGYGLPNAPDEEAKRSVDAYEKSLEKIGLKQPKKNATCIQITTDYLGPLVKYEFPLNTSDLEITKILRNAKGTEFRQVFWGWLGWTSLFVFFVEVLFRIIVWIIRGFTKPK